MSPDILIAGAPGSPYTRKMLAALRYRRIPYRYVTQTARIQSLPPARVPLLPTFYFLKADGSLEPMVDSSLIIRRLDTECDSRQIAPACAGVALLDSLIEDYADEWLTKAMFHYRWTYEPDINKSIALLPMWFEPPMDDETLYSQGRAFANRQISRLRYVGSNSVTGPVIEAGFSRLLGILERHFLNYPFMFGHRPTAADFAIYGQLSQCALFDPTPAAVVLKEAPRVLGWTIAMEDLSGTESEDLFSLEELPPTTLELLAEVGATHVPLLLANEQAFAESRTTFETSICGTRWEQSTFTYHLRCLRNLRDEYDALDPAAHKHVDALLKATGCDGLFSHG
jgi:glutathione S-transferase